MPGAGGAPVEVVVIDDSDDETVAENQRLRAEAAKVEPLQAALAAARAENERLRAENERLKASEVSVRAENERLKASEVSVRAYNLWGVNSDLQNQISKLQPSLFKLRCENAELRRANAELLGKKVPLKRRLSESDADETQRSCPGMLRREK